MDALPNKIALLDWLGDDALLREDDDIVVNGDVVAHIVNDQVFSVHGHPMGRYQNGILYDAHGLVLAYEKNHNGALPGEDAAEKMGASAGSAWAGSSGNPRWSLHDPRVYFIAKS